MVLQSSPGRLGSPPGAHLGDLGALLGASWGALGRSWGALGRKVLGITFWTAILGGKMESKILKNQRPKTICFQTCVSKDLS